MTTLWLGRGTGSKAASEGRGLKLQQDSFPVTQDREVSDSGPKAWRTLSPEEKAW